MNEEVISKKINFNNKKKFVYIFGGIFLVLLIAIFVIVGKPSDCYSIAKKVSSLLEDTKIDEIGEDLEYEYSYIESYGVYKEDTDLDDDKKYAFIITKYNSKYEGEQKEKFLNDVYKVLHKRIDGSFLENIEEVKEFFIWEDDLVIVNGIYIVRINSYYKDRYSEFEKEINKIVNDYNTKDIKKPNSDIVKKYWDEKLSNWTNDCDKYYTEALNSFNETINEYIDKINVCKGEECEQYLNEVLEFNKYEEVADKIDLVQKKYDEVMNRKKEFINSINASISKVERSLNQDEYDNIKKQIDNISDSYFKEYKKEWLNRLEKVKEKTFKNSCKSYNYKNVLRTPSDYMGQKAYWFGVVSQKVSSTQYRVGVDCTKYHYIDGYSCKNTIYVYYYGNTNLIEDDVIKLWGTMDGTKTYTTVLGNSLTIPAFKAEYVSLQ